MYHLALSPASSYLLMLHYSSHFIVYFSYILSDRHLKSRHCRIIYLSCSLQFYFDSSVFFPVCCLSVVYIPPFVSGIHNWRQNHAQWTGGSFSVNYELLCCCIRVCVALLGCSTLLSEQQVMLTPVTKLCCGQVHGILQTSTVWVFNNFP